MISEDCRSRCTEILLEKRTKIEEEIKKTGEQFSSIQKKDSEPKSGQFIADVERNRSLYNARFAELKKVNIRIDELKKGTFTGICPNCGNDIGEDILEENPLMSLCIKCQKEVNIKRR